MIDATRGGDASSPAFETGPELQSRERAKTSGQHHYLGEVERNMSGYYPPPPGAGGAASGGMDHPDTRATFSEMHRITVGRH
ncbi:hypothetical protein VTH06DRAFT_7022 [Thermothelomyces fergusii]